MYGKYPRNPENAAIDRLSSIMDQLRWHFGDAEDVRVEISDAAFTKAITDGLASGHLSEAEVKRARGFSEVQMCGVTLARVAP